MSILADLRDISYEQLWMFLDDFWNMNSSRAKKICDTSKFCLLMNVFNCFMKKRVVYIQEIKNPNNLVSWLLDII